MRFKLEDYILIFRDVLPKDFCEELIHAYNLVQDDDPDKVKRENQFMNFTELNLLNHPDFYDYSQEFIKYMQAVNHKYFEKTCQNLKQRFQCYETFEDYEAPRIKRYEPGTGVFDWHIDNADVQSSRRALVMFWYLNDVEEGGATAFDLGDGEEMRIHPKAGQVACFPPHWMFPHKGETPISGPKYVISSYVCLPQEYGQSCD